MTDWHKEETFKSLIQISISVLKFCLFANGGAAIALLTLVGATSSSDNPVTNVGEPLGLFIAGIVLGGFAHVFAYLTQLTLHGENFGHKVSPKHQGWLNLAIFCVILSVLCFSFGAALGIKSL